jgi:hypothetical protein
MTLVFVVLLLLLLALTLDDAGDGDVTVERVPNSGVEAPEAPPPPRPLGGREPNCIGELPPVLGVRNATDSDMLRTPRARAEEDKARWRGVAEVEGATSAVMRGDSASGEADALSFHPCGLAALATASLVLPGGDG